MSREAALSEFRAKFGREPEVIAVAPGRINLIGEHTDYNEGFVFPAAIDKFVWVVAARGAGRSKLSSLELGEGESFGAAETKPGQTKGWAAYAAGMAWALQQAGYGEMPDIEAVVSGEVPIGSGISSSAAIELAFGMAMLNLAGQSIEPAELAEIAQKCENQYVGVNSGIMDQMASAMGRAGQAMFLDTRSLAIRYAPIPAGLSIVVCDTQKPRALTDSKYNERRSECEAAARILGVEALRDATEEDLEGCRDRMDEVIYRRARHVITENRRCLLFVDALEAGDLEQLGELMRASHESLRADYEVSCPELDAMAHAANAAAGCVGARMTGAGFGGACVALVHEDQIDTFQAQTAALYKKESGRDGLITPCKAADGARIVS